MSSKIQWTDETWNPTSGCTRVSEGCRHCYIERTPAFRMAGRKFVNGSTGVLLHHDRLDQPLHWKKPRRVFVNSLSDLFHEDIPDGFIAKVFLTMAHANQHVYQILTKRPERMLALLQEASLEFPVALCAGGVLNNLWLGVSVEDQATADERIPLLLQVPAAVRFISAEPLLGPVDLNAYTGVYEDDLMEGFARVYHGLDWVIVGGESGPGARQCDVAWIRSITAQCRSAEVPVFVKQLGTVPVYRTGEPFTGPYDLYCNGDRLKDKKGGDMDEWPQDLRVRQSP